ncbi:hypothetical protein [Janthinobacterium fluminis]|uniref:Bacteriocin-type signal sequence-containing protein n=1 Tax=Janthinobacterium fluminis TaxID=2987524 RepID=A0ABT5JVP1_9BURK|nr:hypothetical protein [Janthinobacterium fluminis]MDC8756781.1 hypothetical protein [Janthinobacterium fluminis]
MHPFSLNVEEIKQVSGGIAVEPPWSTQAIGEEGGIYYTQALGESGNPPLPSQV